MNRQQEGRELRAEFRHWWLYGLALVVIAVVVLTGLNYVGVFGHTVVERKVFENSFQYSESRKAEIGTYEAQLAEIGSQLASPNLDAATKQGLMAQQAALRVRLRTAKSKQ